MTSRITHSKGLIFFNNLIYKNDMLLVCKMLYFILFLIKFISTLLLLNKK
jgi:hypothetical protein